MFTEPKEEIVPKKDMFLNKNYKILYKTRLVIWKLLFGDIRTDRFYTTPMFPLVLHSKRDILDPDYHLYPCIYPMGV